MEYFLSNGFNVLWPYVLRYSSSFKCYFRSGSNSSQLPLSLISANCDFMHYDVCLGEKRTSNFLLLFPKFEFKIVLLLGWLLTKLENPIHLYIRFTAVGRGGGFLPFPNSLVQREQIISAGNGTWFANTTSHTANHKFSSVWCYLIFMCL